MSETAVSVLLENGNKAVVNIARNVNILFPEKYEGIPITGLLDNAFLRDELLETIILPKSITSIGKHAFEACIRLKQIELSGVTKIDDSAFCDCFALNSIKLSSKLKSLGASSFKNCGLEKIKIPSKVKILEESVFENCTRLEEVDFPKGLISIKGLAFSSCLSLKSVFLPTKLQKVYPKAFYGSGLETLVFPNTVNYIESSVWGNCNHLRVLHLPVGLEQLNKNINLVSYRGLRILDGKSDLSEYDFSNNLFLKVVELPKKVSSININTFSNNLEKFTFGNDINHFDRIILSALFIKDFAVYEDATLLRSNHDGKGMKLHCELKDIRKLVTLNRHTELNLISSYRSIQKLLINHFDELIKIAEESNAFQAKIILIDIASQNKGHQFDL